MGQKVNPIGFRLGVIKGWSSKWFSEKKKFSFFLLQDIKLKRIITKKLRSAAVSRIEIERSPEMITIIIYSSRPGIIIGRGGAGIEELKKIIIKEIGFGIKIDVRIQEIKEPETDAATVAYLIAEQIEKRIPFRRALKRGLERTIQNKRVQGAKIIISGRLDGSEMSRFEWVAEGKLPLHTLRANIDSALVNAYTTYGVIGIKVLIYKGEIFNN